MLKLKQSSEPTMQPHKFYLKEYNGTTHILYSYLKTSEGAINVVSLTDEVLHWNNPAILEGATQLPVGTLLEVTE